MARPKKKSLLVDGITELVDAIRMIHSKLDGLIKHQQKKSPKRGPGRPPKAGKPGRPAAKRGRGRPVKSNPVGRPRKSVLPAAASAASAATKVKRGRPKKAVKA